MTTIHTTGRMIDPQTIHLDRPLPPTTTDVTLEIVIPPRAEPNGPRVLAALEEIWEAQRKRGHIPPTREEVDELIREGRED